MDAGRRDIVMVSSGDDSDSSDPDPDPGPVDIHPLTTTRQSFGQRLRQLRTQRTMYMGIRDDRSHTPRSVLRPTQKREILMRLDFLVSLGLLQTSAMTVLGYEMSPWEKWEEELNAWMEPTKREEIFKEADEEDNFM